MKKYKFYDTDLFGNEEFDICGSDYYNLLNTCFLYCSTVSFLVDKREQKQLNVLCSIEEYRVPITKNVIEIYSHYGVLLNQELYGKFYEIRHYTLCKSVEECLLGITDSIFTWLHGWGYNNPSDPAFFRADGSTFFYSVIHEGECTLLPSDCEDVTAVLASGLWREEE